MEKIKELNRGILGLAVIIGIICTVGCETEEQRVNRERMEQAYKDFRSGDACLLDGNIESAIYFYIRAAEAGHVEGRNGLRRVRDALARGGDMDGVQQVERLLERYTIPNKAPQ